MLGTAASSITISAGIPGRMEAVKSGRRELLQVEFDHGVLGDLPAFGGPVLQAVEPVLHFGNPQLEPLGQRLVGQGCADDGHEDLVHIGEPSTVSARVCSSIWGSSAWMRSRMAR